MSSRGLANLIGVLGAAAAGYTKGRAIHEEGELRKQQAARDEERYQFEKGERERTTQIRADVGRAMEDQQVEEVAGMGNTDISMAAPSYKLGDKTFSDRESANVASLGVNSKAEKYRRAGDVLAKNGETDAAAKHWAFADQAISEGTDKVLGAIVAGRPSVDAVKAAGGTLAGSIGQDAADIFNRTGGKWKVSPDTVVEHFITKDAAGRELVNSRVLGKDGKPVVEDVEMANRFLLDAKGRMELAHRDTQTHQEGQRIAEQGRHNSVTEKQAADALAATKDHQRRVFNLSQQEFTYRKERDAAEDKRKGVAGQLSEIETVLGPLSPEQKKAYGSKLLGLGKPKGEDPEKLADDLTKDWAKNQPNPTPKDIANFKAGLIKSFGAIAANNQIEEAARNELRGLDPKSPAYAAKYAQATNEFRMTPQALNELGFPPPAQQKAAVPAKAGTKLPAAAAPAQRQPLPASPPSEFQTDRGRQVRADIAASEEVQAQAVAAMQADPELRQMEAQYKAALRGNNRIAANNLLAAINQRKAAYGQ